MLKEEKTNLFKKMKSETATAVLAVLILLAVSALFSAGQVITVLEKPINFVNEKILEPIINSQGQGSAQSFLPDFKRFVSFKEFKGYFEESEQLKQLYYSGGFGLVGVERDSVDWSAKDAFMPEIMAESDRFSQTNVQVLGIDEPDIIKTNGKEIYYSNRNYFYPLLREEGAVLEKMIYPYYPDYELGTKVISAFPPEDLAQIGKIEKQGDLLLSGNILIVQDYQDIYGYNIENPENPKEVWYIELNSKTSIAQSRLFDDKLYLIAKQTINQFSACSKELLQVNSKPIEISCLDIYRPNSNFGDDAIYTAMKINVQTGTIESKISFTGNYDNLLVYMSQNNLFVSYNYTDNLIDFYYGFYKEKCSDLIAELTLAKIEKLNGYDISQSAKQTELNVLLSNFFNSLDDDERLRIENEVHNRLADYYKLKLRELEKTALLKISLDNFTIKGLGQIPGRILNQFSIDEFNGDLRVAVTIGENRWSWGWGFGLPSVESVNDLYILDSNMKVISFVKDMGKGERVYSARFVAEKGYIVTFREIDPFYVLDLADPQKPKISGELKIPGYSSYLHPISDNLILGIGKEEQNVKMSLFNVANPNNPKEESKYILKEYWSDVLNNHHAFLLDAKHNIFFLPASQGGYIFSYRNNQLALERAISNIQAQRAVYIDDYLYIIGQNSIIVLDETNWQEVNNLEIN